VVQINGVNRRILITGAGGFVGRTLTTALDNAGRNWIAATRRAPAASGIPHVVVGDIGPNTDWHTALQGIDCVVHLAARTHVLDERSSDPLAAYRHINLLGTATLARQSAAAGVRRLVFLSSIKVNGEATTGCPYTEGDVPQPLDAYGITKREAEDSLRRIGTDTGMDIVILRPPLVYGPGVKGNFLRLLQAIARGLPLPLASISNRRSLIGVGNLAEAIITCVDSPPATGNTYLVSDGEDVSTPELMIRIARAMGKTPRLLPCPAALLNLGAALLGKNAMAMRLTGSLQIDNSRIRRELGWQPRYSLDQGLNATAQWYHREQN
jgi:nucleoside-diphosphate-sugar epimerase